MRTSRISQETSRMINATSASASASTSASSPITTRRTTRSSLSRSTYNAAAVKDEYPSDALPTASTDIEDTIAPLQPLKRKRTPKKTVTIKAEAAIAFPRKKERKPARQVKNESTGEIEVSPPSNWQEIYDLVKEMRISGAATNAAVDTMGCSELASVTASPKVQRFQTLVALMLSSQTKDTTNAIAMGLLKTELPPYKVDAEPGLTLENVLAVEPEELNKLIWVVGFHNNKTKYIKAAAEILRDQYEGDIPDTVEGMMSLPGVGPKMAYLCMSAAWGRDEGIGVDVHVHRITNLWGWNGVKGTKGPEDTRKMLQQWLPKEKWKEINWLLVGFGQKVCLPVGRKCGSCLVGRKGLCKSVERAKVTAALKIEAESIKEEGSGTMKAELVIKKEAKDQTSGSPDVENGMLEIPQELGVKKEEREEETSMLNDVGATPAQPVHSSKRRKR